MTSNDSVPSRVCFDVNDANNEVAMTPAVIKEDGLKQRPTTLSLKRPCEKGERHRRSMKRKPSQNGGEKLSTSAPLFRTSPMGCFSASGYASVGSMPGTPVPVTSQQLLVNFEVT